MRRGGVLAASLALAVAAAACSLAALDAYDSGATSTGASGGASASSSGSTSAGSSGHAPDGGSSGAPPDASCATAMGTCVAEAPVGWAGPFAFYEGAAGTEPACPSGFTVTVDAHEGLAAPAPAQCSSCECGPSAGFGCSGTATFDLYTDATCSSGSKCASFTLTPGGCGATLDGGCPGAAAFKVTSTDATGSCTPSGGAATLPPVSWTTAARGCTSPQSRRDCPSGSVCASVAPSPFGASPCIAQSGDVPCPAGAYSQKHAAWNGVNEARGCSPCACGAASATCGNFALNPGGDCFGPFFFPDAPLPVACHATPSGGTYNVSYDSTPNAGGACPASGGQPTGTATAQGAVTICCAM